MIVEIDSSGLMAKLDYSISDLLEQGVALEIASDLKCGEGPAWIDGPGYWIFSDIPNNRMLSYDAPEGFRVLRHPSNYSNGNFADSQGGFLTCEHLSRSVTRTNPNGEIELVCDNYNDKRFNSPNDVIEDSAGNIWFTDPGYGILSDEEGKKADSEQPCNGVYKLEKNTGQLSLQIDSMSMPNGLCLAPDGDYLFVGDSGAETGTAAGFNADGPRSVFKFPLTKSGDIAGAGEEFCTVTEGVPDGIRCDLQGNLWVATGAGIECFAADGASRGLIKTPNVATNLCFGGKQGKSLLLTTTRCVYLFEWLHSY